MPRGKAAAGGKKPVARAAVVKPAPEKEPERITQQKGVAKANAFLAAFRTTASIAKAAKAAKIERSLHYRWLKNPKYAAAFERAKEQAAQVLEDEAVRRAVEGTLKPVFYKGFQCGKIREYSDSLMQTLLKAWKPDKYRERSSVEHSGPDGGPIPITDKRLEKLTDDELSALIAVASKLAEDGSPEGGAAPAAAK